MQDELKMEGKSSIFGDWDIPIDTFLPKGSIWEHNGQLIFQKDVRIDGELHVTGPLAIDGDLIVNGIIDCDSSIMCRGMICGKGKIKCKRLFNFGSFIEKPHVKEKTMLPLKGKHIHK